VRQLLMAGLGAAGLLLVKLPAVGNEMAGDTSTFNGEVAATCSFGEMNEIASMSYQASDNSLFGLEDFTITTNAPEVRLNVSSVTTNAEAQTPEGVWVLVDAWLYQSRSGDYVRVTSGGKSSSGTTAPRDISQSPNFRITSLVKTTSPISGIYQLPPGEYSYSVTISCLL